MLSESHSLDLKQLLSQPLTMSIDLGMAGTRYLNGQVIRCKLIGRASATSRYYIYRAVVRPWLWYLTQTPDSKRSEEHTSELQSLMRISYAVFCLKKKKTTYTINTQSYIYI